MDIQATISKLQRDIKFQANWIKILEENVDFWLKWAMAKPEVKYNWREYHNKKGQLREAVAQQKINKSLYKLMCEIRNQMPNDSVIIITNKIREI